MKKFMITGAGLLLLTACAENNPDATTYETEDGEAGDGELAWLMDNGYQVTVDDTFEMISRYTKSYANQDMLFWDKAAAEAIDYTPDTTPDILEESVPTISISPTNKYQYLYIQDHYLLDMTEEEANEALEIVREEIEENSTVYLEEIKDFYISMLDEDVSVTTDEEQDIAPYSYMAEYESEAGVLHYVLIGELADDFVSVELTLPHEDEDLLEIMLDSAKSMTYDKEQFEENPVQDNPTQLGYQPAENLKGDYPEAGYTFDIPEVATFRHSFGGYHPYRYTFATPYEEQIESEYTIPNVSDFVIRVEKEEIAWVRAEEILNNAFGDFVTYPDNHAREVDYLHEDETFDTGIFTTAVRVTFDGYEEYWFLEEIDGHVYDIQFDIALEAEEYEAILESYLQTVRSVTAENIRTETAE